MELECPLGGSVGNSGAMTEVTWDEAPSLQNPLLVVAFEGWFDAGECATGAIQWIVDQYEARRVAKIENPSK